MPPPPAPLARPDRLFEALCGAVVWGEFGAFVGFGGRAYRGLMDGGPAAALEYGLWGALTFGPLFALAGAVAWGWPSRRYRPSTEPIPPPPPRQRSGGVVDAIILGDVHDCWDADDDRYYAAAGADLILWTGDLADRPVDGPPLAAALARLPNAYGILGNHDGAPNLLASTEARGQWWYANWLAFGHVRRVGRLHALLGERDLGLARRERPDLGLTLVGMRPLSSRGAHPAFPRALRRVYGCPDPLERHRANLAASQAEALIVLGHNGPAGLGAEPFAPFGMDWQDAGGDNGDTDYAAALQYAREQGKRVALAVGGHMHDRLNPKRRLDRRREPLRWLDGVPVLNACRVPRLEAEGGVTWHWHYHCQLHPQRGLMRLERVAWAPGREERREVVFEGGTKPQAAQNGEGAP